MLGTTDIPEPLFTGLTSNYEEDITPILSDIFQELVGQLKSTNLLNITLSPYKVLQLLTSQKPFVKTVNHSNALPLILLACK